MCGYPRAIGLLLLAALGGACATGSAVERQQARQRAAEARTAPNDTPYVLAPGDTITVKFFYTPELTEQLPIRPDGRIALQLVGEVKGAGLTVAQLREQLVEKYRGIVKNPELAVIVNSFGAQRVYVGGEVNRPGEIPLVAGMSGLQAVIMAGGHRSSAGMRSVVIVRDQGTETPLLMMVDLTRAVAALDPAHDVRLQARDIVFVPRSRIAQVQSFMEEYIEKVLPISLGFNVTYNLGAYRGLVP